MPNTYTPKQIEQAIKHFKQLEKLGAEYMNQDRYHALTILAALEAAEEERDTYRNQSRWNIEELDGELRICRGHHERSDDCEYEYYVPKSERDALAAYAAKLEKAGDGLADYHRPLNTAPRWQDSLNAWEVARKDKP